MHQFRYSRSRFITMMIASLALTAAITFTVYVLLSTFGVRQYKFYTYATGLVFFGFLSASMIYRFLRQEVVLSIHHGGIVDTRLSGEVIAWDDIRNLDLQLVEQELKLHLVVWPHAAIAKKGQKEFDIDLSILDANPAVVIASIERYQPVKQSLAEEWR